MKTHFLISPLIGLIVGVSVLGCSEKVETEEKQVEVEAGEVSDKISSEEIMVNRLRMMIIPRIDFEDVSLEQARDFIQLRISEVHDDELKNEMRDFVFAIHSSADNPMPVISELRVRNVPVSAVLRYISLLTEMECVVDERITFVPRNPNAGWDSFGTVLEEKGDVSRITMKLNQIKLGKFSGVDLSIHSAIDYMRLRSAELDVTELDPSKKGINFVVYIPKGMKAPVIDEFQIADTSVEEMLKEICAKTGMRYELDPYSVILVPEGLK